MKIVYSAAQEIKHIWKLTRGFIGPQILSFERSPTKQYCSVLQNFSWSFACFCDISLGEISTLEFRSVGLRVVVRTQANNILGNLVMTISLPAT
jgi:hypothetical protein